MNSTSTENISGFIEIFSASKLILLILGLILLGIVVRFVNVLGTKLHDRLPSRRLLIAQIVTTVSFLLYIFGAIYLFYGVLKPSQSLLIAASGTMAVALGLSLKDLVSSVVAGVILLFDRPFQVGDRVTFEGEYGEIKSIGLRATRLVRLDDSVVTIPNSKFITDIVASGNMGALDMMIEVAFHVDLGADLERARAILYETAVTCRYVYLKKPVSIVIDEVEFARRPALRLLVKAYVIDVIYEKSLQTDLMIRGTAAFMDAGITRPQDVNRVIGQIQTAPI